MKLLLITASTNLEKGLVFTINEYEANETKSSYTYETARHRVSKDRLLKVDSVSLNTNGSIHYYTYCLPEDKEKAIEILYEAVNKLYEELSDKFVKLQKSMLVAWSKGIRQLSEEAQETDSIFVS